MSEQVNANGYWWCPRCQERLDGLRVTYEKTHDGCGCDVEWRTSAPPPCPQCAEYRKALTSQAAAGGERALENAALRDRIAKLEAIEVTCLQCYDGIETNPDNNWEPHDCSHCKGTGTATVGSLAPGEEEAGG